MTDKADTIKQLAIYGNYDEIAKSFGESNADKAKKWTQKKADELRSAKDSGKNLSAEKYMTPFMLFVMENNNKESIDKLVELFHTEKDIDIDLSDETNDSCVASEILAQDSRNTDTEPKYDKKAIQIELNNYFCEEVESTHEKSPIPKKIRKGKDNTASKKNTQKRKAETKIEGKPKQAKSAFIFYTIAARQEIVLNNPGISPTEVMKKLGESWKDLSESEKYEYETMAADDKIRYHQELEEFKIMHPEWKKTAKKSKDITSDGIVKATRIKSKTQNKSDSCSKTDSSSKRVQVLEKSVGELLSLPLTAANSNIVEIGGGIKQKDLSPTIDLKHMKQVARAKDTIRNCLYFEQVGSKVVIIVQAYREFLSNLPQYVTNSIADKKVQKICKLPKPVYMGTIIGVEKLYEDGKMSNCDMLDIIILSIEITDDTPQVYQIAFVQPTSQLLITDEFLVAENVYTSSMSSSWLFENAQVKKLFACGNGISSVWYEGSIYYIRPNMKEDPFRSILVTWLAQEQDSNYWYYDYIQTDNEVSPWELCVSDYVLPHKLHPPIIPRELLGDNIPTADSIVRYFISLDCSYIFKFDTSKISEYCALFPNESDRLDMVLISDRCSKGYYKNNEAGILSLFHDLIAMVNNSKEFNKSNVQFQPWRCADMMEKAIVGLMTTISNFHHLHQLAQYSNNINSKALLQCSADEEAL